MKTLNIGICGFGGQGVILSAVILGTTVVTKRNMYAVQTQSYGSEARGGQCQSELVISEGPINSPTADKKDILIALSQPSLERYLPTLKAGGILIVDPKTVTEIPTDVKVVQVSATDTAVNLGNRIAANMVLLGFIQAATNLFSIEELLDVVKDYVPARFIDLNLAAVHAGVELAKSYGGTF
ncbi:MAG: 2-oxoglutarate ferredoxin oxidoreductase subunit gamma [Bacillota bacterium]|nr:MAG: 2-oxoglutarate ferredoxin oxidoreductase subunit gamma [Bacillota bacterium]